MKTFLSLVMMISILISCNTSTEEAHTAKDNTTSDSTPALFPEVIQFPSEDGLEITANLYEVGVDNPVIVLCHQARFNKAEYHGIAERLHELGFNCIAIDQRSGGPIAEYQNETNRKAVAAGKGVDYLDAEQDIRAAVKYASEKYNQNVILWGSSYSSTLALYVGATTENVSAVLSFSPGDYLQPEKESLVTALSDFDKPMFVTSSRREANDLTDLMEQIGLEEHQTQFVPEGNGHHGSRALWMHQDGGDEYWEAVEMFLKEIY